MSNTSMSLEDAFSVAEQLSPMPQIAHEALQTLATEARRWRFWIDVITEEPQQLRSFLTKQPFPESKSDWDAVTDIAIQDSGWKPVDNGAPSHYEDLKHGIHGFDAGIEVGGTRHGRGDPELPPDLVATVRDVAFEVGRASVLFPTWPTDPMHAVGILGEEFGELQKAVVQAIYEPHKSGRAQVRTEAIQTAAMALRFLHSLDQYAYAPSTQHTQWDAPAAPTSGA